MVEVWKKKDTEMRKGRIEGGAKKGGKKGERFFCRFFNPLV
jgi:hypothetical protein